MYEFKKPNMERQWLKNYGHIPANLDYPDKSAAQMMLDNCDEYYAYDALKYTQSGLTHLENFTEFATQIELAAKMLKLNGVKKGDKVIVMLPYLPEAYHSIYACWALGATVVPLHPKESESHKRMAEIIKDTEASTVVCLDSCVADLDHILNNNMSIDKLVNRVIWVTPVNGIKQKGVKSLINPIIDKKYVKSSSYPENFYIPSARKFVSYANEIRAAKHYHGDYMTNVKGSDEAAILFSSGTSGNKPDGCVHTHNSFNSAAITATHLCDCFEPGQKAIVVPGLFHCFGLVTATHTLLNSGVTQLVIPNPKDLENMAKIQKEEQGEIQIHIPLLLTKMREAKIFDNISYDNVALFISGGSTLSKQSFDYWSEKLPQGVSVREGYGSTQNAGAVSVNMKDKTKYGTIGVPMPDIYFKLVDVETNEVINEAGKVGEIHIAGPLVMKRIIGKENPDCLYKDEEGVIWNKTNDLATKDEDGFFTFVDRKDDVLNRKSGNLVNPNEIRRVLSQFGIEESQCIIFLVDIDDEHDKIVTCIEYNADDEIVKLLVKESIKKALKLYLKPYELPDEIVILSSIPRNNNGKALKNEVKEAYEDNDYRLRLTLK